MRREESERKIRVAHSPRRIQSRDELERHRVGITDGEGNAGVGCQGGKPHPTPFSENTKTPLHQASILAHERYTIGKRPEGNEIEQPLLFPAAANGDEKFSSEFKRKTDSGKPGERIRVSGSRGIDDKCSRGNRPLDGVVIDDNDIGSTGLRFSNSFVCTRAVINGHEKCGGRDEFAHRIHAETIAVLLSVWEQHTGRESEETERVSKNRARRNAVDVIISKDRDGLSTIPRMKDALHGCREIRQCRGMMERVFIHRRKKRRLLFLRHTAKAQEKRQHFIGR
jgi:hypothetical protein